MDESKFPFDEKKIDDGTGASGSDLGSATGMFSTPAAPAAPPVKSGSMTSTEDLLQELMRQRTPTAAPPVHAAPPSAPVQAAPQPLPPMEKLVPTEKKPTSDVTRLLEELRAAVEGGASHRPAPAEAAPPFAPIMPAPAATPVPVAPSAPVAPAAEQNPGEFTQIFRQIPTPQPKPAAAPILPVPVAPPPVAPPPVAPAAASGPGEFTQFLQKMSGPGQGPGQAPGQAPSQAPSQAPVQDSGFGSAQGAEQVRNASTSPVFEPLPGAPVAPVSPAASFSGSPAAWPGSTAEPVKAPNAPGSFTQMFEAISRTDAAKPAPASTPPTAPVPPASGPGSFTQMFQAISPKPEPPQSQPPQFSPVRETPRSEPVNQGGFTQLFDSLSSSPQQHQPVSPLPGAPAPVESPFSFPAAPVPPAAPPMQSGGEFTRLMRTLSEPPAAGAPPVQPPMASPFASPGTAGAPPLGPPMAAPVVQPGASSFAQPPSAAGPGEYTRIISGSALREAGGPAPFPPMAPSPQAQARPAFVPPAPMVAPHMPQAPAPLPAAGFGMPQGFAPPAAPPAAPAPQSKMQQYLPLMVVINVVVLLIVVVILIFALRHH